uniref:Acyltransf_C domain-containing protein n=1 Tax=Haemonchus placei TaxID=6290 RepID=A0A0N4WXA2_HAEPC
LLKVNPLLVRNNTLHLHSKVRGDLLASTLDTFKNKKNGNLWPRLHREANIVVLQILLYPEGTDKCPLATERSRKYAEKNGLVNYEYVLHPRTTGFVYIIQNMRKAGYIDFLYDVTIGFGDCIVQSEVDFAMHGVCSKDVHYQVKKIKIGDLPSDDEKLANWLITLWREKEEKLRYFYSKAPSEREFENTPDGRDYEVQCKVFTTFVSAKCLDQVSVPEGDKM